MSGPEEKKNPHSAHFVSNLSKIRVGLVVKLKIKFLLPSKDYKQETKIMLNKRHFERSLNQH